MKLLKYLFFLLLIAIIGASIYITTLNSSFDFKQNRTMKVPVDMIFNNVNDYKNWENWFKMDSTIVISYSEKTAGIGASYTWTGNDENGFIKTTSTTKNSEIIQSIDLGTNNTFEMYWSFDEVKEGSKVSWGIRGEKSFQEKIYWLINGGIEKNYIPKLQEKLELLEQHLLTEMDKHSTTYKNIVDYGGGYYLYLTTSCRIEDTGKKMAEMFPQISNYVIENHIQPSGKPFTLNHKVDSSNGTVMFSACIPIRERVETEGDVLTGYLEPQKTFKTIFKGNYKFLAETWPKIYEELTKNGYTPVEKGFSFEIYTIGPDDSSNPANWLTEIYVPIE